MRILQLKRQLSGLKKVSKKSKKIKVFFKKQVDLARKWANFIFYSADSTVFKIKKDHTRWSFLINYI